MNKTTGTNEIPVLVPRYPHHLSLLHTYYTASVNKVRSNVDCSVSCVVYNDNDLGGRLISSLADQEFGRHHSHSGPAVTYFNSAEDGA